ncbi:MAG TPA: transketolase, partial [bacterium]|nr:transketolase [bacterium]
EMAWRMAMERTDGPTVLALTRQGLPVYAKADPQWRASIRHGAYAVKDCAGTPDLVIMATGSEVSVALQAAAAMADRKVRVVSVLSRGLMARMPRAERERLVPAGVKKVVFEAGVTFGWSSMFHDDMLAVGIDRFGESAPYQKIAEHLGITAASLEKRIREWTGTP